MRYLVSPKNRRVKVVLFILLGTIIPAFLFHTFAYTTLEKKLYKQEHWREIYGDPPTWCVPAENPDLAVICGRAVTGKLSVDDRGNFLANMPIPNMTVEVWEQNPISPTGKLIGNITNVFSSTSTNEDGRFQITMRKVGPPNKSVYLVFKCGKEAQKPKRLDSWHDYWNIVFQLGCTGSDEPEYQEPKLPYSFVDGSGFLGCNFNETEVVFTGMKKQEWPTVNNLVESKNFDHRHTQNTFNLTLSEAVPIIGPFLPTLNFESPGGWWEADCLQKDELSILNNNAPNGSRFMCNVLTACEWANRAWTGFPSQYNPTGQPGSDNIVCDEDAIPGWGEADRLTRPFYPNIPKESRQAPYRRLDIRANLKDYSEERYLGAALTSRLWGSAISDPIGSPHVYLRSYLTESIGDFYISCESLKNAEAPYNTSTIDLPAKNKYLNGGPLGGLFPETTDKERVYNEVLHCDSTITDPTSPAYCDIRKPEEFICNDYLRGRNEQENTAVRFCEIQPTFGDTTHCEIGSAGCGGPCGTLGNVSYVLGREYFNVEQMFPNGDTANSLHSNVFNDSLFTNYRQNENLLFNTEMQNQASAFTGSTRAAAGGGNKVVDGETRNGQKGNSLLTSESIASIDRFVEGTETFADPLTSPFTNSKDDYEDLAVWKIYEIGTPATFCGVGDPWPHAGDVIDGPLQETLTNIQPDNLFQGNVDTDNNPGQLRNKAISSSTWYMSEDAVNRDEYLNDGGSVDPRFGSRTIANLIDPFNLAEDPYLMGLGGNVGPGLDYALQLMPARDVFDSVLSMLQGDSLLHETPENSANFVINLTDVVQAAVGIGNATDIKVFGDRHVDEPLVPVPYYYVDHPLSEETFAYIPGENENGIFVLPPFSEYADSTGYYGNPGTDGIPLMPDDWTDDGAANAACYPWNELPEGSPPCDSFREQYYGVSRTCRVDECKDYWLVETGTCSCSRPNNCWLSDGDNYELQDGDCNADSRLYCAREQKTTVRYRRGEDTEPEDMHLLPWPLGDNAWKEEYKPTERLDDDDCVDAGTDYDFETGGIQEFSVTGDRGQTAHRCNVSRAGPMVGGGQCNGTLEIGDLALRLENRPPNPVPTTPAPQTLDSARTASLKLNNAFKPPFQPTTTGSYLGLMNGSNSDKPKGVTEGMYTYGAEIETTGYGNYNETSQYSTAPISGNKNIPLTDLYYHCHLRGYTPILRGEVNMHPYLIADWPYSDPDMGTVDDDGDGLFGTGVDADGNEVPLDPMDDRSWLCSVLPTPEPEWVEYTNTSGGCAISDIGRCLAAHGVPDTLPAAYFDTVNMAANLAETPAAIIVAVMMSESGMIGETTSPSNYWSDEFKVQMWGRPWYGRIDDGGASQCDDNVWSAQSPYQILKETFDLYMQVPAVVDTFEEIADGRSNSASRCNFLDASIIAAYHLKQTPGGVMATPATMGDAGECGGAYDPLVSLRGYSGGSYTADNTGGILGVYSACGGQ